MTTSAPANGRTAGREGLLDGGARREYNANERRFSVVVQRRIEELLQGERNDLLLLRTYPDDPARLGVMGTPSSIDRAALRLPVIRSLLEESLLFLHDGSFGGPTAQEIEPDGRMVQRRSFPTKYPHIVIEREDVYAAGGNCERSTWRARRVQNQRAQTQINRWLDLANLGAEVVGALVK